MTRIPAIAVKRIADLEESLDVADEITSVQEKQIEALQLQLAQARKLSGVSVADLRHVREAAQCLVSFLIKLEEKTSSAIN